MKRIDKIRQMSSEELAKVLVAIRNCVNISCRNCPLFCSGGCNDPDILSGWLEEEVEEDA